MGFEIDSSTAVVLNELRAKYGKAGNGAARWQKLKTFHAVPINHIEFCQNVLAQKALQLSDFVVEIRDPFLGTNKAGLHGLGFNIASPELQRTFASLDKDFEFVRDGMIRN